MPATSVNANYKNLCLTTIHRIASMVMLPMNVKTARDIDVTGKRVLVRVDFNVPLARGGSSVTDDSRIRATLPTIQYLIDKDAKVILVSHLGRPKGKAVNELRMAVVAQRLSEILGKPVKTATDCIGPEVEKTVGSLKDGDVLLLENIRFHQEEEENETGPIRVGTGRAGQGG